MKILEIKLYRKRQGKRIKERLKNEKHQRKKVVKNFEKKERSFQDFEKVKMNDI